jgi:hypothetical protein
MAATAYILSAISLRIANRFLVPPPTAFQIDFPWLVRAIEETSFAALLTGYVATYWFATDHASGVRVIALGRLPIDQKPRALFGSTSTTSSG